MAQKITRAPLRIRAQTSGANGFPRELLITPDANIVDNGDGTFTLTATGGGTSIPLVTSDPVGGVAWVLKVSAVSEFSGLLALASLGVARYFFSYQTGADGIKRTELV